MSAGESRDNLNQRDLGNKNLIVRAWTKNVYSPGRSSFFNVSLDYCATVEEVGPHQRRSLIIIFESGSPSISMGSKSSSSSSQPGGISLMSPLSRSRSSTLASSSSSEGFSSIGLCSSNHSSNSFCSAAGSCLIVRFTSSTFCLIVHLTNILTLNTPIERG